MGLECRLLDDGGRRRIEGRGRGGRDEGVEDAADGADEIEVDNGAPGDTFCVESGGCVQKLEL